MGEEKKLYNEYMKWLLRKFNVPFLLYRAILAE